MTRFLIILLIALVGLNGDTSKGRKGNKSYHDKKYEEAAKLFREGLSATDESTNPVVRSGLANNLGCALNRTKSYKEASAAFSQAIQLASTDKDLTRSAYNAGNNAFQAQNPQKSLEYYRQALLADPTNEDARYNYEFVRRLMQQQKKSGGKGKQKQKDQQKDQQKNQKKDQQDQQDQKDQQQNQQQGNNSQQQKQQQKQDEQQKQQQPEEKESQMSKEQAEQILRALQNDEEKLMRQVWRMKGKPRTVDKDW